MNVYRKYGLAQDWDLWHSCITSLEKLDNKQIYVNFRREKKSFAGIKNYKKIKHLIAVNVDQGFLDEIAEIDKLEYLKICTLTAENLQSLENLKKLKILSIEGLRKIKDFSPLLEIVGLKSLFLENSKYLNDLKPFTNAHHLRALGIQGSMWTKQKIESLQPLEGLMNIEALFMSTVQLKDKDLSYLKNIPNLSVLACARFAPKQNFIRLRELMPDLDCKWCDKYEIEIS